MSHLRPLVQLLVVGIATLGLVAAAPPPVAGRGVVATDHVLASEAGAEILARGGNAVDAAVAAALSAGVVQPAGSGLGGGGFALVSLPDGTRHILDFRETAPAAAHRDMYLDPEGKVNREASRAGGLAVAIPGEPLGLGELLARFGSLSPRQVAAPAIRQASQGFRVGPRLESALKRTRFDTILTMFSVNGQIATQADVVRRPDLARTLRQWARSGGRDLYRGAIGRGIAQEVQRTGGILTEQDLADYQTSDRQPIRGTYRGYTILTMPPPSSGGVALMQMLRVLEGYDLQAMGHNSSDYVHLVTEVMKHVYADRARFLGDDDFVDVPLERLLSEERIAEIHQAVWPSRTFPQEYYGEPIRPPRDAGTQHISVLDKDGGAVALTTTINGGFGAGVVVPGTGLILNNEMDDFSAAPGVPNQFGLVGSEANSVAPGKRPLSSMSPTILYDEEGEVALVVGASGGSFIISATLQAILNVVDFGMDAQGAVSAPRFHHQWQPHQLWLEPEFPEDVVRALRARGHELHERAGFTGVQLVVNTGERLEGGADPRKGGRPAAAW